MFYAWLLKDLVNYYLNAATTTLDADLLAHYKLATVPGERIRTLTDKRGDEILERVRNILSDMKNRQLPAVHDFYLKMFQFARQRLPFDVILVDEAQDTSGVMLSIVGRQDHAKRLFVGDSFQQIYAFLHAVNSLDRIEGQALLAQPDLPFRRRSGAAFGAAGQPGLRTVGRLRGAQDPRHRRRHPVRQTRPAKPLSADHHRPQQSVAVRSRAGAPVRRRHGHAFRRGHPGYAFRSWPSHRHQRLAAECAARHHQGLRPDRRRRWPDADVRVLRLQSRLAVRRRPGLRRALPAQPAL
ncbi:MAG: hypothetical protein FIA97_09365 [Methylococcaceae bacterium]|nr:hypothetical protein [Methylococcaceae bacterium]